MPRLTEEALATTRGLARSLLADALGLSPTVLPLEPTMTRDSRRRWGPQTIVQAVEAFVHREGRVPSYTEWKHAGRWGLPAVDTVRRYCGSCAALYQAVHVRRRQRAALAISEEDASP